MNSGLIMNTAPGMSPSVALSLTTVDVTAVAFALPQTLFVRSTESYCGLYQSIMCVNEKRDIY